MCSREWQDLEVNENSKEKKTVKARVLHKVVSFYSSRYPSNLDKWFVMGQLVNWLLVCGIVGVWKQVGIRGWLFLEDPTERRYDVMVHENQTYASLMDLWMRIPADVAWPPVDVREDGDVDLFMSRRDNYTIIGSSSGNLDVNVNPFCGISDVSHLPLRGVNEYRGGLTDGAAYWESILGQGEMTTGQQSLLGVCTDDDDTTQLRSPRLTQGKPPFANAMETSEGTESSTDSSAAPLNAFPRSLGKGKVSEGGVVDKTQVSASGGSLSPSRNPNFADPLPYDDSADEDIAAEGNQHLFVRQVFMDRTAFKTHMSLYALAKKFPFICRRSEPGKMVLACKGTNCEWRVYASKLAGCPTFQIKRVDEEHNCTVDERGDFKRHATSNLIGEMVRNNVSTGLLVRHINGGEFEVRGMDGHPFRVDLDKKVCSCLEFDMLLIPCEHAVAAAMHSKRRIDALVGEKFTQHLGSCLLHEHQSHQ
ncbi:hypothetical protein HID58_093246 [Brassica napus]|uniref:SWIM-type domain-containing protein n=1 Tax=Brassica napus TaxID=3708 RepID=A0ABQ7XC14_BRANA|nr:hypothetical protein HID58_093246 [Brassica napus]